MTDGEADSDGLILLVRPITGSARAQHLGTIRRYLDATVRRSARPAAAHKHIPARVSAKRTPIGTA
jgi:hypothetical protein